MPSDSPLKKIILTHFLNKRLLPKDPEKPKQWNDSYDQLIHIEPLADSEVCAIVMKTTKNSDNSYDVKVDIRLRQEVNDHKYKVSILSLEKSSEETHHWDLRVKITNGRSSDEDSFDVKPKNYLEVGQLMDLHYESDVLGLYEFNEDIATPRRICRIGLH